MFSQFYFTLSQLRLLFPRNPSVSFLPRFFMRQNRLRTRGHGKRVEGRRRARGIWVKSALWRGDMRAVLYLKSAKKSDDFCVWEIVCHALAYYKSIISIIGFLRQNGVSALFVKSFFSSTQSKATLMTFYLS